MAGEVERSAGSFLCCLLPGDAPAALGTSQHHESLSFAPHILHGHHP